MPEIVVIYHDERQKTFNSFQDITDYQNVKIIDCFDCLLTQLPELPNSLYKLICSYNKLTELPTLPQSLKILWCKFNNLTQLPELPESLEELYCSNNLLTQLPTLPYTLQALEFGRNQIKSLPVSLLFCRNLTYIWTRDNPLEFTSQQINFITSISDRNIQRNHKGYHQDTQNVHNSALQKSLIISIHNLLTN